MKLSPESQHGYHSVLNDAYCYRHLPFSISSGPRYCQEIMDRPTCDLQEVTVYLDDILVSRANANEHRQNLRALLQRPRKGTTMQAGEMWFCTTLGRVPRTHSLTARSIKRIKSWCPSQNVTTYIYLKSTVNSGHCPILWEIHPQPVHDDWAVHSPHMQKHTMEVGRNSKLHSSVSRQCSARIQS